MSQFTMNSATAQMLLSCGFLAVDKQLGQYMELCKEKWLAYYMMSDAIISQHTHEVPTTHGKKVLLTDSTPDMWSAVQEWRELDERVTGWHISCILNGVASDNDGRYKFIDLWCRHLVLFAIQYGGFSSQSLRNTAGDEFMMSQRGDDLPVLQD